MPTTTPHNAQSDGWRTLRFTNICSGVFRSAAQDAKRGSCPLTQRYKEYLNHLPPLVLTDLLLPSHSSVLLFGTSYMGQIAHGILCANRPLRAKALSMTYTRVTKTAHVSVCNTREIGVSHPPSSPVPPLSQSESSAVEGCGSSYGLALSNFELFESANNVSVVVVANYEPLQGLSEVSESMLLALLRWGRFDHAFFMTPHPRCFFEFTHNKSLPHCVNLAELSAGQAEGKAQDQASSWRVLKAYQRSEAPTMGLQQVLPWEDSAVRMRSFQSAVALIDGTDFVRPYPCGRQGCHNSSVGHQCTPGGVTLISREVARSVWRHREVG